MRPSGSLAASLVVLVCLVFVPAAAAQTAPVPVPAEAAKKEASEHFRSGVELFQEGAFRAALVEFERAYELSPDYRLLYNIGQVQLQLGDYLSATESSERYLTEGGAEVPAARRASVEAELQVLHQRVGRLSVTCNADGTEIFVDDQLIGVTPLPTTVLLNVGRHRVYARGADGAASTRVIDIAGGDLKELKLELKAPTARRDERGTTAVPMSFKRKLAVAAWSASGALLIGAVVTGALAKSKISDRRTELKEDLPDQKKLGTLGDSAASLSLTADIFGGLTIAGVAAGAALWLLDAREARAKQNNAPQLSWRVGLGSVTAVGTF